MPKKPTYKGVYMKWTAWTTLASLVMYFWIFANVARARSKYKVPAPAMDGPVEFQSIMRVQSNTVEQMVIFLPALWLCAYFFKDSWAALCGAIWIAGRIVYALGYYKAPARRGLGFGISMLASVALMIATAISLILH
ncbi:MAG: hypothetical protein JWQ21_1510 [Herminiimonas sp.]|nr:hypothetical protein [Herminiimonas sp.]